MRLLFLFIISQVFCLHTLKASTSDSITARILLERISLLQSTSNGYFPVGSFESYREYTMNKGQVKADFNPFFTGLICFTLRDIKPWLDSADQLLADQIINKAIPAIELFKNKKGRDTYNFWTTDKKRIFPNSGWLNWLDQTQSLPDDFDDTVISLLALDTDQESAKKVHALMQEFINGVHNRVKNTYPAYAKMPVYSTWFGVKMPVDFDVSVLCNVLYFVHKYQLPYTKADSASLDLIVQVVQNKQYLHDGPYISPHYQRLPIILYHLSRLMQLTPIPALENYRSVLITDTQKALSLSDNMLDQVILSTTLYRLGKQPPFIKTTSTQTLLDLIEEEKFVLFIANMGSFISNPYKKWASNMQLGIFKYYAPAYNQLLLLENIIWKKRHELTLSKNK